MKTETNRAAAGRRWKLPLAAAFLLLAAAGSAWFALRQPAPPPPPGMVLIPAGSFEMGGTLDPKIEALPVTVQVSGFFMDTNLVTLAQWQSVYDYATNHGYGFANPGSGKGPGHPVQSVTWHDCVKWCNARSQRDGRPPVYYSDPGFLHLYTNGGAAVYANWAAPGFRLPTEAEWEKAARGGLAGQRFPWGSTISASQACYHGDTNAYPYDLGPSGYNPSLKKNRMPYTSPAGAYPANAYGLHDMAGNVWQWCWDGYWMPYAGGVDPKGPETSRTRVVRGGSWYANAILCQVAAREHYGPATGFNGLGFRCVVSAVPRPSP